MTGRATIAEQLADAPAEAEDVPPPHQPWRDAYDAFCEAMDWTGEEPAVVPLFGRDE